MSDTILSYLAAKKQHNGAMNELKETVNAIRAISGALQSHPFEFSFSNTSIPMPPRGSRYMIDVKSWPDGEKIQQELANWHSTRFALEQAWGAIAQDDKTGLEAPVDMRRLPMN